jgi:hypothetical protein
MHRACWGVEQRHTDTVKVFLEAGVERDLQAVRGGGMMLVRHTSCCFFDTASTAVCE